MRADARRNYEALLTAAREIFLEQGVEAPLDEVARRAGVGAGTLYRHFPSRNDLVAAVYVSDIDAMCETAERLPDEREPGAALSEYMEMHLDFSMRNTGLKRVIREMLATDGERPGLTLCKSRMTDLAENILVNAQGAGAVRKDVDPVTFLRMLHGIALACEDNPEMAPAMLQVMKDGLLAGAK